jgi:hypothetical protein
MTRRRLRSPWFGSSLGMTMKIFFWIAVLAVGVYFGAHWLQENPHAADIQKVQPGVYQPQPPQQPGNRIVVIP